MTNCNICGSSDFDLVYCDAKDYITGVSFQVWQCRRCKVGITWPQPEDLSPYYPEKYRHYNPVIGSILRILYRQRVKKWSTQFAEFGTAFEMGCGNGIMLETLRNLGWKVIGSERTVQSASIPHLQFGLPLFVGGLDALQAASHFDLIFLFQVLEHLEDPVSTLQQLVSALKANGKIIVSVPNFSSWQSKFGQEKWFHLDIPRHLRHYSLATLETLFTQIGMKIENVNYKSLEHDPYGWIQSILNRVDPKFNRLTRLLMQLNRPDPINIIHLLCGIILGILCVPLAAISWLFRNGGLIEVTAVKLE